jgi:chromatin remodeling complex protein RSC6
MAPPQSKKQPTAVSQSVSPDPPVVDASQSKKKKPVSAPAATATPSASAGARDVAVASTSTPRVLPVVAHNTAPAALASAPVAAATTAATAATAADTTAAVPVPVVPTEPATDNVLSNIIDKVNALAAYIKDIQTNLKVLSKEYDKQQKIIEKAQKKRQNAKNSPSGFAKPNKISDELCDFIGVPHGTEKSRTDITRFINAYVKEHNLNKPENKRFILPDAKLKKILNVGDSDEINYFILQKLISHHFPASASKTAAKTAVAPAAVTTAV